MQPSHPLSGHSTRGYTGPGASNVYPTQPQNTYPSQGYKPNASFQPPTQGFQPTQSMQQGPYYQAQPVSRGMSQNYNPNQSSQGMKENPLIRKSTNQNMPEGGMDSVMQARANDPYYQAQNHN